MRDINHLPSRRSLLKMISGSMGSALIGISPAAGQSRRSHGTKSNSYSRTNSADSDNEKPAEFNEETLKNEIEIEQENLSDEAAIRLFRRIQSRKEIQEILDLINRFRAHIDLANLSGKQLLGGSIRTQTVLMISLQSSRVAEADNLSIRYFDDGSIRAEAYVDNTVYYSSTELIQTDGEPVVPAEEYIQQSDDQLVRVQDHHLSMGPPCAGQKHILDSEEVCPFLKWIAGTVGGILVIIPEPGSTVTGGAAIIAVSAAQCDLLSGLERQSPNTDISKVTVCIGEGPQQVTVWPTDAY